MIAAPPRWLAAVIIRLGQPDTDNRDGADRWLWAGGDYGVRIERRTHAWEVFAWTPQRSVSLRRVGEPTGTDLAAVCTLAGLAGSTAHPARG